MAALDLTWHCWQVSQAPRALPLSYVDNLELICDDIPALQQGTAALTRFCDALDLQLDLPSFYAWSSVSAGRRELRLQGYQVSLGNRDLGGQV